jgi:hypothetical protein
VRRITDVGDHAGHAAGHRFGHGVGAAFAARREHHDVTGAVDSRHIAALPAAHEAAGQCRHLALLLRDRRVEGGRLHGRPGLGARTDQQETDRRVPLGEMGGDSKKRVVVLERIHSSCHADHDGIDRHPKGQPRRGTASAIRRESFGIDSVRNHHGARRRVAARLVLTRRA